MKISKSYHNPLKISPIKFENIEEKKVIHEFEYKSIHLNLEKLEGKIKVNELR